MMGALQKFLAKQGIQLEKKLPPTQEALKNMNQTNLIRDRMDKFGVKSMNDLTDDQFDELLKLRKEPGYYDVPNLWGE